MEFKEWLASTPEDFPMLFYKATPNHNPIIGIDQRHTIGNVHDVLRFIQHAIVRSRHNELELSIDETSGIYQIILACSDALHFESQCRSDDGDVEEVSEENVQ